MKKLLLVMAVVAALALPSMVSANTITPVYIGPVDGVGNPTAGIPDGGGLFDWPYLLLLSEGSFAESVATICGSPIAPAGCFPEPEPPVTGSAMFQFFDFAGAVSVSSDPYLIPVGGGPFEGALLPGMPDGWVALVGGSFPETADLPDPTLSCPAAPPTACPTESPAIPNVLTAYIFGDPIEGGITLGSLVIKSIFGTASPLEETYLSQDTAGVLVPNTETIDPFDFIYKPAPFLDGEEENTSRRQANYGLYNTPLNPVPEPASLFLLGTGLLGIGSRLRKRNKKNAPTV